MWLYIRSRWDTNGISLSPVSEIINLNFSPILEFIFEEQWDPSRQSFTRWTYVFFSFFIYLWNPFPQPDQFLISLCCICVSMAYLNVYTTFYTAQACILCVYSWIENWNFFRIELGIIKSIPFIYWVELGIQVALCNASTASPTYPNECPPPFHFNLQRGWCFTENICMIYSFPTYNKVT